MKALLRLFTALALLAFLWILFFAWKNLRGISPVLSPPPDDIVKIVNESGMPLILPSGFSISIFAKGLEKPRDLEWSGRHGVLASIPSQGKVVALNDIDGDGVAESMNTLLKGLNHPHGIAIRSAGGGQFLYVAEMDQVSRYRYDENAEIFTQKTRLVSLPSGGNHTTRSLLRRDTPHEGELYISVGSSCNVCHEVDARRAKILVWTGSDLKEYARGLRNSVFMAFHPRTGKIWATDMGRDLLGDDLPPDEINIIEEGKNYGWPICYGSSVHDAHFDKKQYLKNPCEPPDAWSSHIDIPAHSAPLGLAFFPRDWPDEYRGDLLVAYHGSWNRSVPAGYKIVRYRLDENGKYEGVEDFISGWLTSEGALGRPVDILFAPDKSIYISDDKAGVVYRVAFPLTGN